MRGDRDVQHTCLAQAPEWRREWMTPIVTSHSSGVFMGLFMHLCRIAFGLAAFGVPVTGSPVVPAVRALL